MEARDQTSRAKERKEARDDALREVINDFRETFGFVLLETQKIDSSQLSYDRLFPRR